MEPVYQMVAILALVALAYWWGYTDGQSDAEFRERQRRAKDADRKPRL